MCPLCYIPWLVALLGVLGLGGVHLWVDENPVLAFGISTVIVVGLWYGGKKLWTYYKNKSCTTSCSKD